LLLPFESPAQVNPTLFSFQVLPFTKAMHYVYPLTELESCLDRTPHQALIVADGYFMTDELSAEMADIGSSSCDSWFPLGQVDWPLIEISEQLRQRRDRGLPVDRLHLVAHGHQGKLVLGGKWLDAAALAGHATSLAQWNVKTIVLWCRDMGKDPLFVSLLRELTGSDVYASA